MYWSTDDLQCCVNFCYKAKSLSYTHIYFFHLLFYSGLSQDTEYSSLCYTLGFPGSATGKELACQCRRLKRYWFDPCVRKIPWRRAWQPTPMFLPWRSHGQKSLAGCKESHMSQWLNNSKNKYFIQASWVPLWCPFSTLESHPGLYTHLDPPGFMMDWMWGVKGSWKARMTLHVFSWACGGGSWGWWWWRRDFGGSQAGPPCLTGLLDIWIA